MSSFDVELAKFPVTFLLTEGFGRNRMDRILTIIGFGAESTQNFGFKKLNLSIRYSGTETNAGDKRKTAVGLLKASEKQC